KFVKKFNECEYFIMSMVISSCRSDWLVTLLNYLGQKFVIHRNIFLEAIIVYTNNATWNKHVKFNFF
ncbi:MAG: hypothetical protein ACRYE9_05935, partial [Janthinobacterium lividum]